MSDDGERSADGGEPAPETPGGVAPDGESGSPDTTGGLVPRSLADALAARLECSPVAVRAVLGIALVGLVTRLAWLGRRAAHFDEGRVAYWSLRYARTGHFEYRSIIHGPLVQHVDRWLFALFGPSDLLMRLPVALVGAALPLVALWYSDHLDDLEVVGMAAVLAFNPILLYYSRFLRSDLLVATFMLAALGALLRLRATGLPRYGYAAAALLALGFASKENAAVYVLCWLGAGALLLEVRLFRPHGHATGLALVRDRLGTFRTWLTAGPGNLSAPARRLGRHLLGATGLFLLLVLLLFAPRAGTAGGPGLWRVVVDPTHLPRLLEATAIDVGYGFGYWFGGAGEPGCWKDSLVAGYGCFLYRMTATVAQFATATAALSAVGFLRERYAVADARPLVMFAGFWGVASFLGYPLGTDIWASWVATHVVVPLAIPAAAGFATAVRIAQRGLTTDRPRQVVVPLVVLFVLGAWTAGAAVEAAYLADSTRDSPTDMVQYAQPEQGLKPAVAAMDAAVAGTADGPDVVYYGDRFNVSDEAVADQPPVPQSDDEWFDRLPLPWYTAASDATTASTGRWDAMPAYLADDPPVVVAPAARAGDVGPYLEGYTTYRFDLRAHVDGPSNGTSVVVFVDEQRADDRA